MPNFIPGANTVSYQLPADVRARLAANLVDPGTPEGAAVLAVAGGGGGGGGGGGVTVGPTPPSTGFWVESDAATVTASAVTFSDVSGTGSDTYTIPVAAHVEYLLGGDVIAAGTYPGTGSVTVTAQAVDGYILTGTASWSHTFSSGTTVTATAPTFDDTADTYTIPTSTGVNYQIGGVTQTAGTVSVGNIATSVTITAAPQSGYALTGTTSWTGTYTVTASMWTPAGSTVLTSDSFTGSAGNAESRATDVTWGGSPVTPTTTVAGSFVTDGNNLDATAVGRLRYTVTGSSRVYLGVKIPAVPLSSVAFDCRYGLPSGGGSVPAFKLIRASGLDRVQLYIDGTAKGLYTVSGGDEVGLTVDGTAVSLYINGVVKESGTTATAANTTHGFVSFGSVPNAISDFIVAALA